MTDSPGPREFATTNWSLVVAAKNDETSETAARRALEQLCKVYWYPLYVFVRRRGYSSTDAQDLTQSFFARLIETNGFSAAVPEQGRFRSYLLGAMKHFLANEWNRARTKKRGGDICFLALDALAPENRYALEPVQPNDPDDSFDREWAQASVERAMEALRTESEANGKAELFKLLKGSLIGEEPARGETAARLGMTKGAVKVAVHRLRQRYRELLRAQIAETVTDPSEIVFGSEEIDGLPVITMEIAGAGSLKDQLNHRGPLPVTEAVDAILDVISGLEAALANGVLHRDIKPSNCFVCPNGRVKVGDFGLSVSTLTKTDTFITDHGKILGTPAYASPEQLRGDSLDVRADIYSVGATLFTLLTDRAPFEGNNAVQVVANAVNQTPKRLSEFRDDIPPGLVQAVTKCLAKAPDGRYADYRSLRDALLPFSSREPEPASILDRAPAGWIDYLIAFCRRT